MKKVLIFILAALLLLPVFSSCGEDPVKPVEEFSLTKENLKNYSIVAPDGASSALMTTLGKLQNDISSVTGASPEVKYVIDGIDDGEEEYEIIVGQISSRKEAAEFYKTVRYDDYGYALVGKKILIVGYSDANIERSRKLFASDVLIDADKKDVLKESDGSNVKAGSYEYTAMTLNGKSIGEYAIVYPASAKSEVSGAAKSLSVWIREKSGYILPVVKDSAEKTSAEIQVGRTNRVDAALSGDYCVTATDNGIALLASDEKSYDAVVVALQKEFVVNDGEAVCEISNTITKEINSVNLSFFSYNILHKNISGRQTGIINTIREADADVFGLNEANQEWLDILSPEFPAYTYVKGRANHTGGDFNPIFYKTAKFDLIESGTKWLSDTPEKSSAYAESHTERIFSYVILEEKTTRERFMYIQVHLENNQSGYDSTEARKKQSKVLAAFVAERTYMPIVIGGDFNTAKSADFSALTAASTGLVISSSVAKVKEGADGTWVYDDGSIGGFLDYLLLSKANFEVEKFEAIDNKIDGSNPSDHLPIRIDTVLYQ